MPIPNFRAKAATVTVVLLIPLILRFLFGCASNGNTASTNDVTSPNSLTITTSSLPNGEIGTAYIAALAASGGTPPYTWSLTSGTLPAGLFLNSSGNISGVPVIAVSNTSLMFQVADSSNPILTKPTNLFLTIAPRSNVTVSVLPKRAGLFLNQALSIKATTNDAAGVTWTATGGGFSSSTSLSGVVLTYTAPASAGSYTITATSVSDPEQSSSMVAYVTDLKGVYTYHNDLARDGANTREYALTTATVNTSTFGKLFSCPVDGAVYAQPLWVSNLNINGAVHNVAFVATQHDSLYAFDADTNGALCLPLWHVSLIDNGHGGTGSESSVPSGAGGLVGGGSGDITPEVGVTGTPVIDPDTATLYVVSKSVDQSRSSFYQRLHAIDITTGTEKFGGPANITSDITFPGTGDGSEAVGFNPQQENQRAGLALVNGVVYVAWASHEDASPFYGWIVGFDSSTLAVASVLNVCPNTQKCGIWMSGGAPAADSNGKLYVITANGAFDVTNESAPNNDYGDSFLQLSGDLTISSYFTPSDEANDAAHDVDFGAGGAAVVLNLATEHLVIGGGKDGTLYLLNGDNMGGSGDSNAQESFNIGTGIFATGAFWSNTFYIAGVYGPLVSYSFNPSTNLFDTFTSSQSAASFGLVGTTPSVSSTGLSSGIVWALDNTSYCTPQSPSCGPTVLHAYDATNLENELWNSSLIADDAAGNAVKFTVPTVANGKVYVGTRGNDSGDALGTAGVPGELDVYGLKPN